MTRLLLRVSFRTAASSSRTMPSSDASGTLPWDVELASYYKIEFGEYIEDILTRFMNGEDADESFLPNHYTPRLVCEQKIA